LPSSSFAQTFARLRGDASRFGVLALVLALAALGGWVAWAIWSDVPVYATSSDARIELDSATYPIDAPLLGRVTRSALEVGKLVRRGDVVVELDARAEALQRQEAQARADGVAPQIVRLQAQIQAELAAREAERAGAGLTARQAQQNARQARVAVQVAEDDMARARELHASGMTSARALSQAEAETETRRLALIGTDAATDLVPQEQARRERERDVRIESLRGQIAAAQAQQATDRASIDRLDYEIERRRIRAPIDGRLGEAMLLHEGAVVDEGDHLAAIVPDGKLRLIAQYPAASAFGRLRPGQSARLRLDAFPWAEYGSVDATVAGVAQELRDGRVRVELTLESSPAFRGRIEHGMPGTVDVLVERASPLRLVLRTAGQWLATQP